jgi:hypothetical protein
MLNKLSRLLVIADLRTGALEVVGLEPQGRIAVPATMPFAINTLA